jgi:peptidoglycan/LPS O-acetylase OafA/YrhL
MILMFQVDIPYKGSLIPFTSGISFIFLYDLFAKKTFINHQALINLGRLSFSVYIFHFLFAWDLSRIIYSYCKSFLPADILLVLCFIIATVLTYKVAVITEKIIEQRGINFGKFLIQKIAKSHVN